MNVMEAATYLKLSINRLKDACHDKVRSGLIFVRCTLFRVNEEVVTDRLIVSDDRVKVLDPKA